MSKNESVSTGTTVTITASSRLDDRMTAPGAPAPETPEWFELLRNVHTIDASSGRILDAVEQLTVTRTLDGRLAGFKVVATIERVDGVPQLVDGVRYVSDGPLPLDRLSARTLRDLRLGDDLIEVVIAGLERIGYHGADWARDIAATRKRAGRAGTPALLLAEVAKCRVEAASIAEMVARRPDLFVSESAAHAKVNRALHAKGGPMLERDAAGAWRLTERALELLRDKRGDDE